MAPAQEEQDVRSLRDDEIASLQIRRRERDRARMRPVERFPERLFAAAFVLGQPCDVHVRYRCVLERETNELAAPGNRRPVVQLVFIGGRGSHGTEYEGSAVKFA